MLAINLLAILLLGLVIFVFELKRGRVNYLIDFMRGISLIFSICYVLIPLYLIFVGFNQNIDVQNYVRKIKPSDLRFLFALLLAFFSYFGIVCGYMYSEKSKLLKGIRRVSRKYLTSLTKKQLLFISFSFFSVGGCAFLIYIISLGGFGQLIILGSKVRSLGAAYFSEYGVLVRIAPLLVSSSVLLFVSLKKYRYTRFVQAMLFFFTLISIILALTLRFHLAGRLSFIRYIITFPLIVIMYKRKIKPLSFSLITVALFIILFYGDSLFNFFIDYNVNNTLEKGESMFVIISQFSFPFANIYHVIENVPNEISFRYFKDFYIGFINLLPQSLLNVNELERLSVVNTQLLDNSRGGAVPVDLVTFGYYNIGLLGVLVTSFLYGSITRYLEAVFYHTKDYVIIGIRVLFLMFWIFTVMYSDPSQVFEGGFYLIMLAFSFVCMFFFKILVKKVL